MKRALKNILMVILIAILLFLTYYTLGYLKWDYSLNNKITVTAKTIYMNEENVVSTETVDESGNVTTTSYEGSGEVTEAVDPDSAVTSEEDLYTTTDEEPITDEGSVTTADIAEDNSTTEKSLILSDDKLSNVSYVYYIVFGVEGLLVSLTLGYLAFSKFNKLTLKETLYSGKRVFGYILYTFLLLAAYVLTVYYFI